MLFFNTKLSIYCGLIMRMKCYLACVFLLCLTLISTVFAKELPNPISKFMTIADIHFDPFASCAGQSQPCELINQLRTSDYQQWRPLLEKDTKNKEIYYYHNSSYPLFKLALAEVTKVNLQDKPKFVLILGDFLAHDYRGQYTKYTGDKSRLGYQSFVKKTFQFLATEINKAFPQTDVYVVVGNNDSYTGDYSVIPRSGFFQDVAHAWADLIKNKTNKEHFLQFFPSSGYYAVTVPGHEDQRILILNTVLFSAKGVPNQRTAAQAQLTWLKEQLLYAQQHRQHVILAYHIPVGIDVYATLKNALKEITEFWRQEYRKEFEAIIAQNPGTVVAILPAHIHMDAFQIIALKNNKKVPVIFTPSISPIFGNNPGFKVFTYEERSFRLVDFDTYYYPLNRQAWEKEYTFNHIYQPECHPCKLVHGMAQLTINNELADAYKKFYATGDNSQPITSENAWLPYYWCGIWSIARNDYVRCMQA